MVPTSVMFRAAWAVIAAGLVLVLANWYAQPESAPRWTVSLATLAVLVAVLRLSRFIVRRTTMEPAAARGFDQISTGVAFGAAMMVVPLALTLARVYGLIDGADVGRRSVGVLTSVLIVMLGNAMPKNLPPLSSGCDGARQQAFHRLTGWTWVLCGLASALAWLVLPIGSAPAAMMVLMATALALSVVHLVRLVRLAGHPGTKLPSNGPVP